MDSARAMAIVETTEDASAKLRGPDADASLARLKDGVNDAIAALEWFVAEGRSDEALRMASALYRFWITTQGFADGDRWFGVVLGLPGGTPRLRGQAFIHAGFMPFWLGHDDRAAGLFGQGLEIGRAIDDPGLVAQALGGLARVALRSDVAEGRRLAREELGVSEAAANEAGRSDALHLLGVGAQVAGDLPEARTWMVQRLALVRAAGNDFLVASEASNLAMVERQLGDLEAAERLGREAIEICERIGDQFTTPFAIAGLAAVATERSEFERAAMLLGAAEAIMEAQQMAWPPDERPHYERMLRALPEAMGGDAFERARMAGRTMPRAEAIEIALGSRSR
jgi:non-specific serine/threonine protein kinase